MELLIKNKTSDQLRDSFVIEVEFMFGDADGEEILKFPFSRSSYDSDPRAKKEVHDFIRSIQEAIALDNKGRGGFQSSREVANWYGLGLDSVYENRSFVEKQVNTPIYQWSRFCEDDYDGIANTEELEVTSDTFLYSIPTYDDGWYSSYQDITVFYYDSEGYKYNVKIKD